MTFDINKILSVDKEITKKIIPKNSWDTVRNKLIIERNKLFFERLNVLLTKNSLFVVVGASHLGGDNGLLKQFAQAGFTTEPLEAFK